MLTYKPPIQIHQYNEYDAVEQELRIEVYLIRIALLFEELQPFSFG